MNHQLVRQGGDLAIGAYGILNSYAILIVMSVMGLCQGMQPIVGYNYGAQQVQTHERHTSADTTCRHSNYGNRVCGLRIVPGLLVSAFTSDPPNQLSNQWL